ncbi:MAG: hypothetical protein NVS4B1_16480 [Ktedonobacteraceae bacterium]
MSDFVESAKNFMNSAVSRTGWEAQKQLRVRSKQSELDKLWDQRQQLLNELGNVAMNLYQQGSLTDAQLSRLCASIQELDHDARNRETQLQEIKNEAYPADQFAPTPTANYAPPPTSPPVTPAAPSPQPAAAGAAAQMQPCPHCGQPVRVNALYCRNCGSKLH